MLSPSCRVFARQLGQKRLLSASRPPAQKCALVKSSIAIIGVSSAIAAAYFLLPHPSRSLPTHAEKLLSPSHFTPATLVRSVQTSPDTKLFTLSVPPELIPQDSQQFAPIWSVFIKDDDIQVERPYTPLQGVDENGHMLFWIKKYDRGEVARWLHSKQPGSSIEIRGPLKTWAWKDGTWDDIIMISGGTGITPFYQLLHNVFSTKTGFDGRFTLFHASRTLEDLPSASMMDFLNSLAEHHPDKFKFRVFVDPLGGRPESKLPGNLTCERIEKSALRDALGLESNSPWWKGLSRSPTAPMVNPDRKVLVLVCGPEQMVNAIAGPYGHNYSQGKVAGVLGQLGLQPHQVWKL